MWPARESTVAAELHERTRRRASGANDPHGLLPVACALHDLFDRRELEDALDNGGRADLEDNASASSTGCF